MFLDLINLFFEMQINIKLYHWMTSSYSRHKATDKLLESLSEKIDRFVEIYIGRHGKPKSHSKKNISYSLLTDAGLSAYLKDKVAFLEQINLQPTTDLENIRAEMIESMHQALYLLSLQ